MKILSIDTASNVCGVSILEDDKLICNLDLDTGRTHSENLIPMIIEAFNSANLSIENIDLVVCDIGPGSFTGIRIGVSTAKAFQDSLGILCIGVSSLESLAYNEKENLSNGDFICSIIDCKNNNFYYAIYQFIDNHFHTIVSPKADNIDNFKKIELKYENITFVGDGVNVYYQELSSLFPKATFSSNSNLNSYRLGLCGLNKFKRKQFDNVLPLYLKKPQAQRQLEENLLKKL